MLRGGLLVYKNNFGFTPIQGFYRSVLRTSSLVIPNDTALLYLPNRSANWLSQFIGKVLIFGVSLVSDLCVRDNNYLQSVKYQTMHLASISALLIRLGLANLLDLNYLNMHD